MARLDWAKNRENKAIAEAAQEQYWDEQKTYSNNKLQNKALKNGIWPVKGKYIGKKLSDLPTHYLNWIINNFNTGPNRQAAVNELSIRHQNNSSRQSIDSYQAVHNKIKALRKAN